MVVNCAALRNEVIWAGVTRCSCFYCWQWGEIWCCVPRSDSEATDVQTPLLFVEETRKKQKKHQIKWDIEHFSWNVAILLCESFHLSGAFPPSHGFSLCFFWVEQHQRGVRLLMKQVLGQKERSLDSTIGSLCAVDNDLINESILAWQPWIYPSLGFLPEVKNPFWIPSALLLIRSIRCHRARKSDLHQKTFISVCSPLGQRLLAARKKVNT